MSTYTEENKRNSRVILAAAILGLQIFLLILLLLRGDSISALTGAQPEPTAVVVQATAEPSPEATPTDSPQPEPTAEEVAQITLPSAGEAGVLAPEEIVVDASGVRSNWLAQIIEGIQPDEGTGKPGVPPHLLLGFADAEGAAPPDLGGEIDLNQPQVRVVPLAALLAWLQARGDADSQTALDQLRSLIDEQPPADEASVPVPPILANASQPFAARVTYGEFNGGRGVGYVTNITGENLKPATNESGLNYIFQGITNDGRQYVFMTWPVAAAFLPETDADVPEEISSALQANAAGYYGGLDETAETAADPDFRPNLSALTAMLGSLAVGADQVATIQAAQPVELSEPADLAGTVWRWTGFSDAKGAELAVDDPENYELVLWPDGTFNVKADCNVGGGAYELDGSTLSLALGPLTRAMCPPESLSQDFIQKLGSVATYVFDEDNNLVLNLFADGGDMVFTSAGPADVQPVAGAEEQPGAVDAGVTGFALQWPGFTNPAGETITVDNPEDYQLVLLPDGTFNIKADCNVGRGTYTYDESGALQLNLGPLTSALCGPDSQSDAFLAFVNSVNGVAIAEDGTVNMTTADGGSATFVSGGPVAMPEIEMAPDDELIGTVWQWTRFDDTGEINDITVDDPESYLLVFLPGGAYTIKADCNVGRGSFTRESSSLTLMPGPLTVAQCPPDSLSDTYVRRLAQTATYLITDEGDLVLNLKFDSGNMVFANGGAAVMPAEETEPEEQQAADRAGLTSLDLQWPGFTDAGGNVVTVDNPEDYRLVLYPDGTFNVQADCNVGRGTYTYNEDGTLALLLGPLTRALCPPDSQSDAFLNFLTNVNSASTDADGNIVLNTADGSTAALTNAGGVAVPEVGTDGLTGVVWQWTSRDDASGSNLVTVDDPEKYSIVFNEDSSYNVVVDCNVGGGSYEVDGDQLTINPGFTTLVACEPPTFDQEFLGGLAAAESFSIDPDGNLVLTLADDAGTMTFANGGAPAAQTGDALNIVWQWNNVTDPAGNTTVVENPEAYYLVLLDDGTYVFRADCNTGAGAYTLEDGVLTLLPGATTLAACAEGSLGNQFTGFFGDISGYGFDGDGNLVLTLGDGTTLGMGNAGAFEGMDTGVGETGLSPDPLNGTTWRWSNFRDAKQDYSVPTAAEYTIAFNADGTVFVVADCNTGRGTYNVDGSSLTISPLAATLVACPEGSLGSAFLNYLPFAGTFTLQGSTMFIDLMADGGRMTFVAVP